MPLILVIVHVSPVGVGEDLQNPSRVKISRVSVQLVNRSHHRIVLIGVHGQVEVVVPGQESAVPDVSHQGPAVEEVRDVVRGGDVLEDPQQLLEQVQVPLRQSEFFRLSFEHAEKWVLQRESISRLYWSYYVPQYLDDASVIRIIVNGDNQ